MSTRETGHSFTADITRETSHSATAGITRETYLSFTAGIIRVYAGGQQPNQRSVGSNVITADVIVDKHVIVTV